MQLVAVLGGRAAENRHLFVNRTAKVITKSPSYLPVVSQLQAIICAAPYGKDEDATAGADHTARARSLLIERFPASADPLSHRRRKNPYWQFFRIQSRRTCPQDVLGQPVSNHGR